MKHTASFGEGDEGEEPWLPFGRPTDDQSTRRDTSDDAYRKAKRLEARNTILCAIRKSEMTCDEVMQVTGLPHQTASATMNWLMRNGHIIDSRQRRKTRMDRSAIVWRYEAHPVPLKRTRPTRRELEQRIASAIETIDRNHSDMVHLRRILAGETR
jgi:predicted transcriptional regulator